MNMKGLRKEGCRPDEFRLEVLCEGVDDVLGLGRGIEYWRLPLHNHLHLFRKICQFIFSKESCAGHFFAYMQSCDLS
jgi:hypothetical protein